MIQLLDRAAQHRRHGVGLADRQVTRMLELEAERVDVLDEPVVQVAGDPVALGDHGHLVLLVLDAPLETKPLHPQRDLAADLIEELELGRRQSLGIDKTY